MFDNLPNYFNTKLSDLFTWLELVRDEKWYWFAHMRCKYVNIRIDTRHGGSCYITDDKGNQMTLEELMRQVGNDRPEWVAAMAKIKGNNEAGNINNNVQRVKSET